MTGILGSSCGACKFLRRRCTRECVFAPYFSYEQAATHFAAVHKVFGASNVSKLLMHLPIQWRSEAALTISYEALARVQDPIYGCVAQIFALQQQVATLKDEIETIGNQMANLTFDLPRGESFEEVNNNSSSHQFPFWNEDVIHEEENNCVDHHQDTVRLPQTGINRTPPQQAPLNAWKNDASQLQSNPSILESVFQELGKTGYLLRSSWPEQQHNSLD